MSLIQILILSILSFSISDDKLVFLMTHFRHGARAPQRYKNQSAPLDRSNQTTSPQYGHLVIFGSNALLQF